MDMTSMFYNMIKFILIILWIVVPDTIGGSTTVSPSLESSYLDESSTSRTSSDQPSLSSSSPPPPSLSISFASSPSSLTDVSNFDESLSVSSSPSSTTSTTTSTSSSSSSTTTTASPVSNDLEEDESFYVGTNNHSPKFNQSTYFASMLESSQQGTEVVQVYAIDADEKGTKASMIQYLLLTSDSHFSISSETGIIYLTEPLDYETSTKHHLIVAASDQGSPLLSSTCQVWVNVIDVNDNGPKFTKESYAANISEASSKDMFVTKVTALDVDYSDAVDGKLKYSIESGDSNSIFRMDPSNGIVSLAKDQSFIYDVFTLNVSVSDGRHKDYTSLTIKILYANKQSPLFARSYYSAIIDEQSPVGTQLATVEAFDNDDGIFAEVTYSIFSSYLLRWFKIDSKSGEIITVAPINRRKHQSFSLTVLAKDGGHRIGLTVVKISVNSENEHPPQFLVDKYEVAVCSNTPTNTNILPVIAYDKDVFSPPRSSKNRIHYSISHIGLPDSLSRKSSLSSSTSATSSTIPFRIRKKTGLIHVYGNLSNSVGLVYTFQVKAIDESGLESVVPVTIKINGPCKSDGDLIASYEATVFETAKVNSVITTLNVSNPDNLELTLAGVNSDANKFKLGEKGQIYLIDPLDRETVSRYILVVKVFDTTTLTIRYLNMFIDVLDTNDNVPIFDSDSYWIEVSEDQEVGSSIGRVHAIDGDIENSQKPIVYKLERDKQSEADVDIFEFENGLIKLRKPLDRETDEWHNLTVTITDGKFNNQTSLVIRVMDVNDNPPQFSSSSYNASIREGSPVGMIVTTIEASDADDASINSLSYFIISGDPLNQFSIKDTGELVVNKLLNHKDKNLFHLTILVSDTKYNATTKVTINVLEAMGPVCRKSEYVEIVSEDIELGTDILKVEAESKDGPVNDENVQLYYSLFLNNEKVPINSNSNDNGLINTEDTSELPFALNSKTGVLTVIAPLDREKKSTYFLVAKVHDDKERENMCSSAIEIIVSDINDNEPHFTSDEYRVTISEDAQLGIVVGKVQAGDLDQGRNGEVYYSLTTSAEDTFTIDRDAGLIRLNKPLDREDIESYTLTVKATDLGLPPLSSSVKFIVSLQDVSDNAPVFSSNVYNVSVLENVAIGAEIVTVEAKDADIGSNGDITYSIIEGADDNRFIINSKTGNITVTKLLDREAVSNYILTVQAMDAGSPPLSASALINLTVSDVNDNGPICERTQYVEMVPENVEIDSYLLKIVANDPDEGPNGQLYYNLSLDSADYDSGKETTNPSYLPFKIDPSEGILRVASSLDREEKSRYLLHVVAHDNLERDRTCSSTVEIVVSDVNDNAPIFTGTDTTFLVPEDVKVGSFVGKAIATDADIGPNAKIVYSLTDDNEATFSIDPTSGSIHTAKSLDRETVHRYSVMVTATDSGSPALFTTQTYAIHILDVNDNAPKFTENHYTTSVYENVSVGISLIQVVATSLDTGINADITYTIIAGNEGNCFTVHPKSGSISVVESLDRETNPEYILTIQAKDGGIPSLSSETKVTITILDVNDNAPYFSQSSYSAIIREDAHVGEKIIQKVANDADIGENGQINYFFKSSSLTGSGEMTYQTKYKEFEIEPKTGVITVASPLDRDMTSSYIMEVVAVDKGSPPLSSSILITIDLSDVNGYPPKLDKNNYTLFIQVCILSANGSYTCLGPNDYRGLKCEIDGRRACNPNPCVNGGTCTPSPGSITGFHCECPPTLGGLTCEKSRFCSKTSPCLNNGICEDSICKCKPGWRGSHCEDDIDECTSSNIACSPPATCINLLGSYRCICPVDVTTSGSSTPSTPKSPSLCANYNLHNTISTVDRAFLWDDLILPGIFLIVMLFSCCVIIFCCCCFNRHSSKSKRRTNNRTPANVYRPGLEGDEFLLEICSAFPSDSSGNIKRFSKLSGVESSSLLSNHRPFSTEPLPNHHFHQALQAAAAAGGGIGGVGVVGTPNGQVNNVGNGQAGLINNRPNSFNETMNNFDEIIRTPLSERASSGPDSRTKRRSIPKNSPTAIPVPPYSENESSHLLTSSNESKIQNIGF